MLSTLNSFSVFWFVWFSYLEANPVDQIWHDLRADCLVCKEVYPNLKERVHDQLPMILRKQ